MQGKKTESERQSSIGRDVPIVAPGIGTRIKAAADRIGSRTKAASAAGISDDMLYKYIREQSNPSFSAMAGLAAEARVRLEWLATGEGDPDINSESSARLGRPDATLDALEEITTKILTLL